jgi:threonyl-tRNA synthetase
MKKPDGREQIASSVQSRMLILWPDGRESPVDQSILDSGELEQHLDLKCLVEAELLKSQPGIEPPSIKAMQELELVDYEPASDKGHFRFYPKGELVFDLLHRWAEEIALVRLGAYAIETPILYDWSQPDIRSQGESFHERHYIVTPPDGDEEFVLRFAGDFGLFRMMRDAQLTYRHLPVRMYEFAPSFRYEKSGELSGLRRLRGFWMPDVHSFCKDLDQGLEEYEELYKQYTDLANGAKISYAVAFRIVGSFYDSHKEDLLRMINYSGRPVLIEALSDMKHYWVMKHEINSIDTCGGTCQVSTVQLDIKDASIYGINYVDSDGEKKGCTIVHSSIGSPERWIFSILEDALKQNPPTLPLWLSPIQVRVIPVSAENHLDSSVKIAEKLRLKNIRVEVDDRNDKLGWKIRSAGRDWIPFSVVIGDKEIEGDFLSVTIRETGEKIQVSAEELAELLNRATEGMPFRQFPGMLISKRPVFRGRD